jgi:voltage-dependent calcium channel L type alpha-1D
MWRWFSDYIGTIQFDPTRELAEIPDHSAFFILSPDNSFRVFCYKLVRSKAFNVITYVTIFLGSVLLTLEIPITSSLPDDSLFCLIQDVIIFVDLVIVIYFLVEMFLKMTALGVFLHRGSYLRGFFNIMDFVITMTTLIPVASYFYNLTKSNKPKEPCLAYSYQERLVPVYLATLRVFRVFRPMRAIRISAFYVVVTGLLSSIKSIGRILFINVLVMSIFAIIGTILFRGSFFYCTDPSKLTERECRGHFFTYPTGDLSCPELNERRWLRHGLNFDNFGQSFLTLFAMVTSEGWQEVMYNAYNSELFQDTNDPVGPRPGASPYSFIFFLLFMCTTTLVLLNMFIGFVIVTFQEVGIKAFRESKLDRNQRNCLYFALTTKPQFRYVPKFRWQERLLELTRHPLFSGLIIFSLSCNSIVLCLQTIDRAKVAVYWINFFFTILFCVEAVLKITALHPVNYFKNVWNFVVFLSTTGAVLEFVLQQTVISDNSDNQ